ncbi:hypothetical protein RA27_15090 [Ruegeria sp. ANG-R]|uniref:hypothetical protein n=1 Tax=Ruegeria sp. ANG-R TaxID=1577903 RepID=UPI00057D3659|nr:hypothetical protein [Ruegeria sp. ANG-R]KIC40155.1 hypothetical protein RA27_15090 [Ruegeria sp. ANG-R]
MSFTLIDDLTRLDHSELTEDDRCIFLREYRAGDGFKGETNSLIWNLKKKPSERLTKGGYHHKARAIAQVSREFASHLNPDWLNISTLIPIPGSKSKDHPDYDNRMEQICRGIREGLDVRPLIYQTESTEYSHNADSGERLTVEQLMNVYAIDENLTQPEPVSIGIFDDVLTIGRHYRAMHNLLSARFPNARITGIFVARTIHPNPFENADLDWF